MRIYLIGYMYSGKTSAGKSLAKALDYTWVDTDQCFEQQFNTDIPSYFEQYGETSFRLHEREILRQTFKMDRTVISVGGGLPCFENNMALIKAHGQSVYLEADVDFIMSRIKPSSLLKRPLLANLSPAACRAKIEEQLSVRKFFYEQADLIMPAKNFNPKVLVDLLFQ